MKARGLFSSIWIFYCFLVVFSLLFFLVMIKGEIMQGERERAARDLKVRLELAAPRMIWAMESPVQLQEELRELGREMGARLLLLNKKRRVRADSLGLTNRGQHLPRSGLLRQRGWMVWDLGHEVRIVAQIPLEFAEGQVLLAMQQDEQALDLWSGLRARLVGMALIVALLAGGGGWWFLSLILAPLKNLHEGAKQLAGGDLDYRLRPEGSQETRTLAQDFNWLAREAKHRLDQAGERRNELEALFQGVDEGFLIFDAVGHLIRLNEAAREILGISRQNVEGCEILELVRHPGLAELAGKALSGLTPLVEEFDLRQPERRIRVAAFSLSLQERQGLLLVLRDRTQLHHLERVRREFVANVSHELKTPVTSIRGFAETLMNGALEDPQAASRFVGIILNHAKALTLLIEDLLSLARVEEQSLQGALPMQQCDLSELVAHAVERIQPQASEQEIEIQVDCPPGLKLQANASLLTQCLVNLLENALKYSPDRTLVQVVGRQEPTGVTLEVADQGEGIPLGERERIFERFYRVDKSRSRNTGGTGLGLSIVKHIVGLHGGEIKVEAVNPQGSLFLLMFSSDEGA